MRGRESGASGRGASGRGGCRGVAESNWLEKLCTDLPRWIPVEIRALAHVRDRARRVAGIVVARLVVALGVQGTPPALEEEHLVLHALRAARPRVVRAMGTGRRPRQRRPRHRHCKVQGHCRHHCRRLRQVRQSRSLRGPPAGSGPTSAVLSPRDPGCFRVRNTSNACYVVGFHPKPWTCFHVEHHDQHINQSGAVPRRCWEARIVSKTAVYQGNQQRKQLRCP